MAWWLARSEPLVVFGLLLVFVSGCARGSLFPFRPAVTRPEPSVAQGEEKVSSRSDRLRDDAPYTPASLLEPASVQARPEPEQPSENARPSPPDEPDPRAVIDWLLKERR